MPTTRQECPICFEVMDDTDLALLPCQCDYQVCLWCLQRIRQQENNRCPQCRREYDEASYRRVPIATILSRRVTDEAESVASSQQIESKPPLRSNGAHNESRRSSLCGVKGEDSESQTNEGPRFGKHPTICRLYNCPTYLLNAQALAQFRYLGKYGRLLSIVICNVKNPDRSTAFATYAREEDAILAQQDIAKFVSRCGDSIMRNVRFQIGAARHCIQALRGMTCTNEGCPFIHGHVDKGPKYFWKATKKGPNWMRSVLSEKLCQDIIQDPVKESLFTLTLPDIQKLNYGIFIPNLAIDTEKREWCQVTLSERPAAASSAWQSNEAIVTEEATEAEAGEDESSAKGLARRTWQRVSLVNERQKDREEDPAFPALCRAQATLSQPSKAKDAAIKDKIMTATNTDQRVSLHDVNPDSEDASRGAQTPSSFSENHSAISVRLSFIPPPPSSPSCLQLPDASAPHMVTPADVTGNECRADALSTLGARSKPSGADETSPATPTTVSPPILAPQQRSTSPRVASQASSPQQPSVQRPASSQTSSRQTATALTLPTKTKSEEMTVVSVTSPPAATERVGMKVFLPPPGLVRASATENVKSTTKDKPGQHTPDKDDLETSQPAPPMYTSTSHSLMQQAADNIVIGGGAKNTLLYSSNEQREVPGRASYASSTTAMSKNADAQTSGLARRDPTSVIGKESAPDQSSTTATNPQQSFSTGEDYQPLNDYFRWEEPSTEQQTWLMDDKSTDFFDCLYNDPLHQSKATMYDTLDSKLEHHRRSGPAPLESLSNEAVADDKASDKYISAWLTNLLGQLSNTQSTPASTLGPQAQQTLPIRAKDTQAQVQTELGKYSNCANDMPGTHNIKSGWSGLHASPQQPTGRTSNTKLYNYYTASNPQQLSGYSNVSDHKLCPAMEDYSSTAPPIQHLSARNHDMSTGMQGYRMDTATMPQWSTTGAGQHYAPQGSSMTNGNPCGVGFSSHHNYDPHLGEVGGEPLPSGHLSNSGNTSHSASVAFLRSVVPNATINISSSGGLGSGNYGGLPPSAAEEARSTLHRNRLNIGQPAYYRQEYS